MSLSQTWLAAILWRATQFGGAPCLPKMRAVSAARGRLKKRLTAYTAATHGEVSSAGRKPRG